METPQEFDPEKELSDEELYEYVRTVLLAWVDLIMEKPENQQLIKQINEGAYANTWTKIRKES